MSNTNTPQLIKLYGYECHVITTMVWCGSFILPIIVIKQCDIIIITLIIMSVKKIRPFAIIMQSCRSIHPFSVTQQLTQKRERILIKENDFLVQPCNAIHTHTQHTMIIHTQWWRILGLTSPWESSINITVSPPVEFVHYYSQDEFTLTVVSLLNPVSSLSCSFHCGSITWMKSRCRNSRRK